MNDFIKDLPSLEVIYNLEYEVLKADVLKTALEIDLFTVIYKGYNTIDDIANTLALDLRGVRILMDALCPLGFLQKTDSVYDLTPFSETYLVQGKETFYGDWTLKTQHAWQTRIQSATAIKTGKAIGGDYSDPNKEDDWTGDYSPYILNWRKKAKDALERWHNLGINKKNYRSPNILDIAWARELKALLLPRKLTVPK